MPPPTPQKQGRGRGEKGRQAHPTSNQSVGPLEGRSSSKSKGYVAISSLTPPYCTQFLHPFLETRPVLYSPLLVFKPLPKTQDQRFSWLKKSLLFLPLHFHNGHNSKDKGEPVCKCCQCQKQTQPRKVVLFAIARGTLFS